MVYSRWFVLNLIYLFSSQIPLFSKSYEYFVEDGMEKMSVDLVKSFSSRCQPKVVRNGFFFTLHMRRHLLNQIRTQVFEGFEPQTKNSEADVLHIWHLNRRSFAKKYLGFICD